MVIAQSTSVGQGGRRALAAYNACAMDAARPFLALNLLLDDPARLRDAELKRLHAARGRARSVRVEPRHALAGGLTLECEHGQASAELTLAPGPERRIQLLRFAAI